MIIDSRARLAELLGVLDRLEERKRIVLDSETTGLDFFGLVDRRKGEGPIIEAEREIGPARICGLALGIPNSDDSPVVERKYYLPIRHETGEAQMPIKALKDVMEVVNRKRLTLIGHNIKFDMKGLWADGCLPEQDRVRIEDTMILAHLCDERLFSYGLDTLSFNYLGIAVDWKLWVKDEFKKRGYRRYSQFLITELGPYAEKDLDASWALRHHFYPLLSNPEHPWYGGEDVRELYHSEMEALWSLMRMEIHGVKIDTEKCASLAGQIEVEIAKIKPRLADIAGWDINPRSSPQLKRLWVEKGWPIGRSRTTGNISFSELIVMKMDTKGDKQLEAFIGNLSLYRHYAKFLDTYLETYQRLADEDKVIHTTFNQHRTVTGRLSSSDPNFQNIPKIYAGGVANWQKQTGEVIQSQVRTVVIPHDEQHRFVSLDYAQQEIRMFLNYVDEPTMRKVVLEGGDIHHMSASAMFGGMPDKDKEPIDYTRKRHLAKTINFGIIYGMGPRKLADLFDLSQEEALRYYNAYLAAYPNIKDFVEHCRAVGDQRKWVRNAFGRRRRMRLLTSEERRTGKVKSGTGFTFSVRPTDETADCFKALNSIIQGGCADLTRRAMINIDAVLKGTNSYMVNQVHDEIVIEFDLKEKAELVPLVTKAMTDFPQFKVPFTADYREAKWNWAEAKGGVA